jgi:hypothetical protein
MPDSKRSLPILLIVLALVIGAFWVTWYTHRSLVAASDGANYVSFENAFPLADGVLALGLLTTAALMWRRRPLSVATGLMSAGGGLYLFCMDALFDLEHSIWTRGVNGIVELAINVVTLGASVFFARWIWLNRRCFDPAPES